MSYLYDCWYMVGWSRDINSTPVGLTLLDQPVVFFRGASGKLIALADRCPHKLAPLSLGRVEGDDLRCMYHGLKFNGDGRCIEVPGQDFIPKALCTNSYPIVEAYSAAWIWMGNPDRADLGLIPPFGGIDDPDWKMLAGRTEYDANYTLVNENLLDLSHVAFVHRESFGGGEDRPVDPKKSLSFAKRTTEALARGIRTIRVVENAPINPGIRGLFGDVGDTWSVTDFYVPGIFLLTSDVYVAGSTAKAGGQRPDKAQLLHRTFTCQAVTPMTQRSTCYHFAFGPWAQSPLGPEPFIEVANLAFEEDRVMITAQQRVIDRSDGVKPVLLPIDKQGGEFNRIMNRLIEEQNSAPTGAASAE